MLIKVLRSRLNNVRRMSRALSGAPVQDEFQDWRIKLHSTMKIYENFISQEEEGSLLEEVEPYLNRLRYEYAHWDNMIHGYRETEFLKWNDQNMEILNKIKGKAFPPGMPQLKFVHILDLAEDGWIKPHVDSKRFCGEIIATISLLSDCVMRLTRVGHEKDYWDDFLIPRRSLYIMDGVARHDYNHEVLKKEDSLYGGEPVKKLRRISIICRSEPD